MTCVLVIDGMSFDNYETHENFDLMCILRDEVARACLRYIVQYVHD